MKHVCITASLRWSDTSTHIQLYHLEFAVARGSAGKLELDCVHVCAQRCVIVGPAQPNAANLEGSDTTSRTGDPAKTIKKRNEACTLSI